MLLFGRQISMFGVIVFLIFCPEDGGSRFLI
jgi:hypothetical protein